MRMLTRQEMPYALLMYIWENRAPVGTVIDNLHTGRIKMIVAGSGKMNVNQWHDVVRNVREDYERAFKEAAAAGQVDRHHDRHRQHGRDRQRLLRRYPVPQGAALTRPAPPTRIASTKASSDRTTLPERTRGGDDGSPRPRWCGISLGDAFVQLARRRSVIAACLVAMPFVSGLARAQERTATAVVFENVRVFFGDRLSGPTNVLVAGNVIQSISAAPVADPPGAVTTRVRGGGRTLMPGLIDAHTHVMFANVSQATILAGDIGYVLRRGGHAAPPRCSCAASPASAISAGRRSG